MATLQLNVLGIPALLDSQGQAVAYLNKKTFALLVYVAMHPGQSFSRDELATLLWPENALSQARLNLRQGLQELHKQFPELEPLRISAGQMLQLPDALLGIDALTFIDLIKSPQDVIALNQAMAIYRGEFMQGFNLQTPVFDQWVAEQRQQIQQQRQHSLQSLATQELHATNSQLNNPQQIVSACLQAAQLDLTSQQYQSALRFLDRAEGLCDDSAMHAAIVLLRGDILLESGTPLSAISAFEQAYKLTPDPLQQAHASIGMARGLLARQQFSAANQLLDPALATLVNTDRYTSLAQLHYCRGILQQRQGLSEQAMYEHRLAVKFAELATNALWLCRTLQELAATALRFAHFRSALTHTEQCLRHAQTHKLNQFEIPCLILRGQAQLSQNRLHDCFLELEYALSLAKRDDDLRQQGLTLLHLAELSLWQDRHATALAYSDSGLQCAPTSVASAILQALHVLAEHMLHNVHDDDDRIDKAYMQSLEHNDPASSAIILAMLSRITADPQRRLWAWEEAERLLTNLPVSLDQLRFYQHAIEAAITHEHWNHARRFAEQLRKNMTNDIAPFYTMFADRALLLARIATSDDDQSNLAKIERLRKQAFELNLLTLLPAYDAAQQRINLAMDIIC